MLFQKDALKYFNLQYYEGRNLILGGGGSELVVLVCSVHGTIMLLSGG